MSLWSWYCVASMDQTRPGRCQWMRFHTFKALSPLFLHEDLELPAGELLGVFIAQSGGALGALAAMIQLLDFGQQRFPVQRRALFGSGFLQRFVTAA